LKPHIHLEESHSYQNVIVCGPPERALSISQMLDAPRPLSKNREYHSYFGTFKNSPVLVISHGIGAPGAAICFRELIDVGAKTIVRVGTAGSLQNKIGAGDIVIPEYAIRNDGTTRLMVPENFSAESDEDLTQTLTTILTKKAAKFLKGSILTSDLFYPELLDPQLEYYSKAGVLAVEMECSALFVLGKIHRVRTAAILVMDGNPLRWKEGEYVPRSEEVRNGLELSSLAVLELFSKGSL